MIDPAVLLTQIGRLTCHGCKCVLRGPVRIVGQAILPGSERDKFTLRVEWICPRCHGVSPAIKSVGKADVLEILLHGIRRGATIWRFRRPVTVSTIDFIKPSVRKDSTARPISDAEMERAKRLLARTSFKRDSKSWLQFLKRIERGR